jgi:hypothetical protein
MFRPHLAIIIMFGMFSVVTALAIKNALLSFYGLVKNNTKIFVHKMAQVLGEYSARYLLELPLGWSRLQHIRDGNCRIAVGEVRVVSPATDGNSEPVPWNSGQGHVVVLPDDTLPALEQKSVL